MFMIRTVLLSSLLLVSTSLFAHHGGSHDEPTSAESSHLDVTQPWARATPPGAAAGGGFLTITNHGSVDDRLVGASAAITDQVEIHTMEMVGDVMRMQHLPGGIEIPAGETVTLAPGGLHLMFMALPSPIEEDQPIPLTLEFQHAESIETELQVVPVGASPEGQDAHADHHAENHGDHHEEHGQMAH
ncbi:copper chaperone PCu(A)C [Halomonas sp. NPDC076908]|uniref:copper chaperone PCu(A)C n=1 Tax=Halomonas sp. NPDC076908 TaxID=3390567 RepID=UPI003D0200EB